jgi:hypothetical protein
VICSGSRPRRLQAVAGLPTGTRVIGRRAAAAKEETLPQGQGSNWSAHGPVSGFSRAGCVLNSTFLLNLGHAHGVAFFLIIRL